MKCVKLASVGDSPSLKLRRAGVATKGGNAFRKIVNGDVASAQGGPASGWELKQYMYYVYIIKSKKNDKLYKGFTNDLKRRVREHNSGKSKFTSINGPWELLYYEAFKDKVNAKREEKFLKSGKGRERIKYLFDDK